MSRIGITHHGTDPTRWLIISLENPTLDGHLEAQKMPRDPSSPGCISTNPVRLEPFESRVNIFQENWDKIGRISRSW